MADVIVRGVIADIALLHWQGACQRPRATGRWETRRKTRPKSRI
jgi:hypothetical protein